MSLPNELFQIPAPFDDLRCCRKTSDKAERIDLIKRQCMKGGIRKVRGGGRAYRIDDFAAADCFAANPCGDGIPVNERKRCAMVVHGYPRPTAGFRRRDYRATVH